MTHPTDQPGGFGQLAKRMRGWTTNLLFTAIVLVAGLSLGRQTLEWWRVAPADPNPMATLPSADDFQFGHLDLADSPYTLDSRVFQGSPEAARTAIRQACRDAILAAPETGSASPAEEKTLEMLAKFAPVDADPAGRWQLYELAYGMPLVVGVGQTGTRGQTPSAANSSPVSRRVLVWGTILATGEHAWNLYLFRPRPLGTASIAAAADFPLPPGSRQALSLASASGARWIAFEVSTSCEECRKFYLSRLKKDGSIASDWQRLDDGWQASARWSARADTTTQPARVLIRLSPTAAGTSGLIMIEP